jgi:hypothetical protein
LVPLVEGESCRRRTVAGGASRGVVGCFSWNSCLDLTSAGWWRSERTTWTRARLARSRKDEALPPREAICRIVRLDAVSYQSWLELQDQLHRNICRRRTLVAIGTHDPDAVRG